MHRIAFTLIMRIVNNREAAEEVTVGKTIVPGKNQFAIENAERTLHLDDECFRVWQEEASRT